MDMRDEAKRDWQAISLTHVGSVADVMQKKSGPTFDPSPMHTVKRGNGPR
jgi:hypothetical protein